MTLNEDQALAIRKIETFLRGQDKIFCLTGFAGSGKTFTLGKLQSNLKVINTKIRLTNNQHKDIDDIFFTATTAKAASLIEGAKTIHKLLGLYVWKDFKTGKSNLKERNIALPNNCIVVVDEASMIDTKLMGYIRKHINKSNVKYIFSGDHAQLKSVQDSFSVFEQNYPTATLTIPMRQDPNSSLFKACETLRRGVEGNPSNVATGSDIKKITQDEYHELLKGDLSETKIVTYRNANAIAYNQLERKLNHKPSEWGIGDYVVVRSFYEPEPMPVESLLCIAHITTGHTMAGVDCYRITFSTGNSALVAVNTNDIKPAIKLAKADRDYDRVKSLQERILDIRDASAGTVHTSQGSSYDTVVVDVRDIMSCHIKDMKNRMLYTAVSRARKQVYLLM